MYVKQAQRCKFNIQKEPGKLISTQHKKKFLLMLLKNSGLAILHTVKSASKSHRARTIRCALFKMCVNHIRYTEPNVQLQNKRERDSNEFCKLGKLEKKNLRK